MSQSIVKILTCLAFIAALSACGVRGPLEPPPGHKDDKSKDNSFILDGLV